MNIENLSCLFRTGVLSENLLQELQEEVPKYVKAVMSEKGSKDIYGDFVTNDIFCRDELVVLLESYLKGEILEWELEYILNFVDLSFEYKEDMAEDIVFTFSDPYLNYSINSENILEALAFLRNEKPEMDLIDDSGKELRKGYRSIFVKK